MTEVRILTVDGVERLEHAPSREARSRLMALRSEIERVGGADFLLPLVRRGLDATTDVEALDAAEALEGMLARELEWRAGHE